MFTVRQYDRIGSTNDEARRLGAEGAAHGTVVHADEQTSGRGRLARGWFSPPGNLYMSVLLRFDLAPSRLVELSFLAAVAVADAVAGLLPPRAEVRLKWPNDVLVDGGKIAGILLENAGGVTILGIGLNVLRAPETAGYRTATVLGAGGLATVDGARDLVLERLERLLAQWTTDGFAPIRDAWMARAFATGTRLRVNLREGVIEGGFAGLDHDGALLLMVDGATRRIVAGDIIAAPG
jgi:BirA family biotin operon repressor/biotin-[acetyl-CoA-carboxylase] ligase